MSWQSDIKPDAFWKCIKAVKAGRMIYESRGRPVSWSQNSKLALVSYISSGPYNVREVDFVKKLHQSACGCNSFHPKPINILAEEGAPTEIRFCWGDYIYDARANLLFWPSSCFIDHRPCFNRLNTFQEVVWLNIKLPWHLVRWFAMQYTLVSQLLNPLTIKDEQRPESSDESSPM